MAILRIHFVPLLNGYRFPVQLLTIKLSKCPGCMRCISVCHHCPTLIFINTVLDISDNIDISNIILVRVEWFMSLKITGQFAVSFSNHDKVCDVAPSREVMQHLSTQTKQLPNMTTMTTISIKSNLLLSSRFLQIRNKNLAKISL